MKNLLLIVPFFVLMGCADSGTQGDVTERNYEDLVTVKGNSGAVTLNVYLYGSSDTATDTDQDTKNAATIAPKTSASLAEAGATAAATLGQAVTAGIEGVTNTFTPDNSDNSDNSQAPNVSQRQTVPESDDHVVYPDDAILFDMRPISDKSFTWLEGIGYKDTVGSLKFDFNNGCGSFVVPDATHQWGEDGTLSHNQRWYFAGRPSEQKEFSFPGSPAGSVFTAPGCVATQVVVTKEKP